MKLYQEILAEALSHEDIKITFPNLKINAREIVELQCYKTLQQIKKILDDDSLSDQDCFIRIEAIVQSIEALGSNGGCRHDFG